MCHNECYRDAPASKSYSPYVREQTCLFGTEAKPNHINFSCFFSLSLSCFFPRSVRSVTEHVTRFVSWGSGWIPSPRSWPVFGGSGRNWLQRMKHYGKRRSAVTAQLLLHPPLLRPPPLHTLVVLPPPLNLSFPPLRSTLMVSWTGLGRDHQGLQSQNQWGTWTWTDNGWVNKRWVCSVHLSSFGEHQIVPLAPPLAWHLWF